MRLRGKNGENYTPRKRYSGGGWWMPGASLDLAFTRNLSYPASTIASALAITRASVGYAESAAGVWSSFSSGALRLTDKGLLIEEARMNSIRNNSMQGAVAGTPGTAPTNWIVSPGAGISSQIVGVTPENGIDCIDVRFFGTASGSVFPSITFEGTTNVAAAQNSVWAHSAFLKLVSGTLGTNGLLVLTNFDAGGVALNQFATASISAVNSSMQRLSVSTTSATFANAATAFVRPSLQFNIANGVAVDFTLRIGWPQLELGAFATSPIRTTSAAATRAADVITVNNPTNYLPLAQGSVFAEWTEGPGAVSTIDAYLANYLVNGSNLIAMQANTVSTHKPSFQIITAGASQAFLITTNAIVANTTYKYSVAWETNRFALRVPSSLGSPANDTSGSLPSGSPSLKIGAYSGGSGMLNGYLRQLTLFPSPQSDTALAQMVA